MKRLIPVYCFLIILLAMSGCTTQTHLIKVYSPAKLELPPSFRGILVFNRFVPATGDYDRVKWGAYDTVDSVLWRAADSCALAFSDQLNSFDRFVTKMPSGERMFQHNGDSLPDPLPWEGLGKIAGRHYADGMVMLEALDVQESEPKVRALDDGFEATVMTTVKTGWRIYEPKTRRILDETVYQYDVPSTALGNSKTEAISALPAENLRILNACREAGRRYAEMVHPGEIEVKRKFYSKGHKVLVEGHDLIESGEWGKAEKKWKYHSYKGETEVLKAKCSYNMAILSEKEGFIPMALGYARRAQKLLPAKLHLDLINELTSRMLEIEDKYASGEIIKNW